MTEPIGPGPRADFACLSRKCKTDEGAPTYELPVQAKRCPVCGSTRIARVWSGKAPGLIRSGMRDMQHHIDAAGSEAQATKTKGRDAALEHEKLSRELAAKGAGRGIRMVQAGRLNAELASQNMGGLRVQPGGSQPSGMSSPLLAGTVAGRRVPTRPVKGWGSSADVKASG